ncbi:hypothetical protein PF005_g22409 [Phytophthora fragariae]|nr:hypothetical protein PF005_g22409 [Phytophthora fragariae]
MEVQGFTKGKEGTSRRALVKSTLGWERVYKFEMWVMDHSAGVEVVLGTDFMIPAGVRLDLFHATAQLPDEVKIPLVQTQSAADDDFGVGHVVGFNAGNLLRIRTRYGSEERNNWCQRWRAFVADSPIVFDLRTSPRDSRKYKEWQVLAFSECRDSKLFEKERRWYEEWLSEQPPTVEQRSNEDSHDNVDGLPVGNDPAIKPTELAEDGQEAPTGVTPPRLTGEIEFTDEPPSEGDAPEVDTLPEGSIADPVAQLELTFVSVLQVLNMEGNKDSAGTRESSFKHQAHGVELEDYAQELGFLPDLTEVSVTVLDYSAPNVLSKDLEKLQQAGLIRVLKKHERIMISSGNALPPPAYGVVCDIDVKGHTPIKRRARRVPLQHLRKLYEL